MVTPKRVFETTPLVVAQIEQRERAMRSHGGAAGLPHRQDAKRDPLTTSQKLGRS
jgi:hypothetical protein